jgi:hypothetical protein
MHLDFVNKLCQVPTDGLLALQEVRALQCQDAMCLCATHMHLNLPYTTNVWPSTPSLVMYKLDSP